MPVNEARLYGNPNGERDVPRDRTVPQESTGKGSTAYDPAAVPAWARESVARTARDHQGAPGVDPTALDEGIRAACGGGDPIDELCESWLESAREHGIAVDDENGDTLLATVIPVITAAFWSGLTTGHYAITRECSTPRRLLPCFERAATGSRGY